MPQTAIEAVTPNIHEREEASRLLERLARSRHAKRKNQQLIRNLSVSPEFARFLSGILENIAAGCTISVKSLPDELTTTVAANELSVSRGTLMKWVREGKLPAHKVGTHTRLMRDDVLELRDRRREEKRDALSDLLRMEDDLDIV